MAEVKLEEETELWGPRSPAEEHTHTDAVEPAHLKEEPELCIEQEFPFHMVTVKTEDDEDKSSVLHQRPTEENREETNGRDYGADAGCSSDPLTQFHSDSEEEEHTDSSEDTDHSEDYSQEQAPAKRSYAMIPPDASVRDRTPYTCSECGRNFREKSHLKKHKLFHSAEMPHKCPECGMKFSKSSNVKRHMLSHTGERPHKCPVCEKGFTQKGSIRKHLQTQHHMCTVCDVFFPDNMKLKEHLKTHVKDGTVDQSILKSNGCSEHRHKTCSEHRHKTCSEHRPKSCSEHRPYSCSECGKCFRWKSKLEGHQLSHSREKPHKCPECGMKFSVKSNLKRHMLSHTGERPHKCPFCEKGFTQKVSLTNHLKTQHHMDQSVLKSHSCSREFEKTFIRKENLQSHTGHSDETPHKCLICEKCFYNKSTLNRHLRDQHHTCRFCEKSFPDKIKLNEHITKYRQPPRISA